MPGPFHVAIALDGAGWHPAAWREPSARPDELFDASYWIDLVRTAERGAVDFVTFEDGLTLQSGDRFEPDDRVDQVRGRLDAALIATRVAPVTTSVGLVPTVTTTHTEPFNISARIATLDFVSHGRAGWRVQTLEQRAEVEHFGRRQPPPDRESTARAEAEVDRQALFDEAADAVEVVRRLWDSWEDDAEIRDQATGRFIDRDRLHSVDFEGPFFSVRGPSITPRPPQGQPVVVVLAHVRRAYELAARSADVVFVTPRDAEDVVRIVREVRSAERDVGRDGPPLRILADVVALLEDDDSAPSALARLDARAGAPLTSDAAIVASGPRALADTLVSWRSVGVDGVRLRPARLPADLEAIVDTLLPLLPRRATARDETGAVTLRERLGLARPTNRYATRTPAAVGDDRR